LPAAAILPRALTCLPKTDGRGKCCEVLGKTKVSTKASYRSMSAAPERFVCQQPGYWQYPFVADSSVSCWSSGAVASQTALATSSCSICRMRWSPARLRCCPASRYSAHLHPKVVTLIDDCEVLDKFGRRRACLEDLGRGAAHRLRSLCHRSIVFEGNQIATQIYRRLPRQG